MLLKSSCNFKLFNFIRACTFNKIKVNIRYLKYDLHKYLLDIVAFTFESKGTKIEFNFRYYKINLNTVAFV